MDKKIHIWQLPEKDNDVDKSNDISIVYSGNTVYKVNVGKLYDYLNQDYKINNMYNYFLNIMNSFSDEYNKYYELMQLSLDNYHEIVMELQSKFSDNKDNIRNLESIMNQLLIDIDEIEDVINPLCKKCEVLLTTLSNFQDKILGIEQINSVNTFDIKILQKDMSTLVQDTNDLVDNSNMMINKVESIRNNNNESIENARTELINKIYSEYDRVLSIIDYYHHIHEI